MSIDRRFEVAVGYWLDVRSLAPVTKVIPEGIHFENRYDQVTGAKLPEPVKVVDSPARVSYHLGDEEYEDLQEVYEELGNVVGARVQIFVNYDGEPSAVFGPMVGEVANTEEELDNTNEVGPKIKYFHLLQQNDEVARIGFELTKLGIDPGEPMVGVGVDES